MTTIDTTTLVLLEEHVRRLLRTMDFPTVEVHCRLVEASPVASTAAVDDSLFRNAALETPDPKRAHAQDTLPHLKISIEAGDDGRRLIGMQGAHLDALQHIIRTLLRRQLTAEAHVWVDVNGYRARREEGLTQLAQQAAAETKRSGRVVELKPMTAADRRAIHTALAARRDVTTESRGEEPRRRVVIRPV